RSDADDGGRFERPDRAQKIGYSRMLVRVMELVIGEIVAAFHDETAAVDEPAALARVGFAQAVRHHGGYREVGYACRRFARAEKKELLVGELLARDAKCRKNACERDRCG